MYNIYLVCLKFIGVMGLMPTRETYCTRWKLRNSSTLRAFAIQTTDIFIKGWYLKYLDFLSQEISFWLGIKSSISSQAWAHQASNV